MKSQQEEGSGYVPRQKTQYNNGAMSNFTYEEDEDDEIPDDDCMEHVLSKVVEQNSLENSREKMDMDGIDPRKSMDSMPDPKKSNVAVKFDPEFAVSAANTEEPLVRQRSLKRDFLSSQFLGKKNERVYQMVQATLIKFLATGMKPMLRWYLGIAFWPRMLSYFFIFWALIEVTNGFVNLNITPNTFGGCLIMFAESIMNRSLVKLICIDFTFSALVKLRLFNGYMAEDTDLTNLSALFHFSTRVNLYFKRGVSEAQRPMRKTFLQSLKQGTNSVFSGTNSAFSRSTGLSGTNSAYSQAGK